MIQVIQHWFKRYFSDPEAVLLVLILLLIFGLIVCFGQILAPVLASILVAYLLEWGIQRLQYLRLPRLIAVCIVFVTFFVSAFVSIGLLFPLIWRQMITLCNDLPEMLDKAQDLLLTLVNRFPDFFSTEQIRHLKGELLIQIREWAKVVVSASWSSITTIIAILIYLILVPLLVFFLLKDKEKIIQWFVVFLPAKRGVLRRVTAEVNGQIANYIRGKVVEILLVGGATYIALFFFDLNYAILLSCLVGLSVLIPYVGGIIVTIPVILVGYLQWGYGSHFGYCLLTYGIIQALDANILVPLLFSEAMNVHPVAIIVATLFFGGIWGFWGIFFAIPLATLVKAVLNAWPRPIGR